VKRQKTYEERRAACWAAFDKKLAELHAMLCDTAVSDEAVSKRASDLLAKYRRKPSEDDSGEIRLQPDKIIPYRWKESFSEGGTPLAVPRYDLGSPLIGPWDELVRSLYELALGMCLPSALPSIRRQTTEKCKRFLVDSGLYPSEVNYGSEPLTENDRFILEAMLDLGAMPDNPKSSADILKAALDGSESSKAFSRLRKAGYIDAKTGIGRWLTESGLQAAKALCGHK
jgi:hypothetical protein